MVGVGLYYFKKNSSLDDYYVGGRNISYGHIGFSVVATDVGGGFSVGLGGLGFTMGLSGSWMLFTGLLGAWLSAVLLIPRLFQMSEFRNLFSLPEVFQSLYGKKAAIIAAIISFIGYLGFTSSQVLAGAKLATATISGVSFNNVVIVLGIFTIVYTALGGLKAVIMTDTIQWIILLIGLIGFGLPFAISKLGGFELIKSSLDTAMLNLWNISWVQIINWSVTIIPIWFVGMTLYQRIFASRNQAEAQKAWFLAGLLEWPIMAFVGVALGLLARVAFIQGLIEFPDAVIDSEMGLPLLLREVLPAGITGVVLAAYFSAIMSTADSCLMAASGNVVNDLFGKAFSIHPKLQIRLSQLATALIGLIAIVIALKMKSVLELMLLSYGFMVSGLFIPIICAFGNKRKSQLAAIISMVGGGATTSYLVYNKYPIWMDLNPNIIGISASLLLYVLVSFIDKRNENRRIYK